MVRSACHFSLTISRQASSGSFSLEALERQCPPPVIDLEYNFGYTFWMKTAISIPDKIFEAAEIAAKKLGMSRSELYVNAVREYVDRYGQEDVTEKLDAIYSNPQSKPSIDSGLTAMQNASLPKEDW